MINCEFEKIAIIGIGRMGGALLTGLIKKKIARPNLYLFIREQAQYTKLRADDYQAFCDLEVINEVDIIFIAVKPKDIPLVLNNLRNILQRKIPIISLCASYTYKDFYQFFDADYPLLRARANIFIQAAYGNFLLAKNEKISLQMQKQFETFFTKLGQIYYVEEEKLTTFTWDSSTNIGVIFSKLLQTRASHFTSDEEAELALTITKSSLQGWLNTIEILQQQYTAKKSLDFIINNIVSTGGLNEKMLNYLQKVDFWQLYSKAIKIYEDAEAVS